MIQEYDDIDPVTDWHWRSPYLIDDRRAARRRYWSSRLWAGIFGAMVGTTFGLVMRMIFT